MAKFTEILIKSGGISAEQLAEAEAMAKQQRLGVADCLIKLGYATDELVMKAMAKEHGLRYADLDRKILLPRSSNSCPSRWHVKM